MSPTTAGIVGMVALLALLFLRMPIGIAMALVGAIGIAVLNSPDAALHILGSYPYSHGAVQALSVIPLFVLMGNFAVISGMSSDLFTAAYAWLGHRRGGLASATVLACAGFAALSGSSVASAITMGRVTLPEMRKYRYDPRLATGVVAAGGTLGILIPPSTVLVIYGILTEQSIGKLFMAGFLPGLLLTALFIVTVVIVCAVRPAYGPPREKAPMPERWAALRGAGAFFVVLVATIGGMYAGVFTVTEASGVGAALTMSHAILRRRFTWAGLSDALLQTVRTTAMVFLILIGAHIFSPFLAMSRIPVDLAGALTAMALPALAVLAVILVAFIILGMFLEGFAILVLTVPILLPIMMAMNFDPIWFGIFMVIILEMGLISPPVGINVFVVKGIAEDVPMYRIFAGILPFWVAMIVCVAILVAFPQIALILPNTMYR
jgi:tripartite ATP-independent transporter DctM subunit